MLIKVPLELIQVDEKLQSRVNLDWNMIEEYSLLIQDGVKFPPLSVVREKQESGFIYYLHDGYHRYYALQMARKVEAKCHAIDGDYLYALKLSFGANHDHGIRRTKADRTKAILNYLFCEELMKLEPSIAEIARTCRVSETLVRNLVKSKKEMYSKDSDRLSQLPCLRKWLYKKELHQEYLDTNVLANWDMSIADLAKLLKVSQKTIRAHKKALQEDKDLKEKIKEAEKNARQVKQLSFDLKLKDKQSKDEMLFAQQEILKLQQTVKQKELFIATVSQKIEKLKEEQNKSNNTLIEDDLKIRLTKLFNEELEQKKKLLDSRYNLDIKRLQSYEDDLLQKEHILNTQKDVVRAMSDKVKAKDLQLSTLIADNEQLNKEIKHKATQVDNSTRLHNSLLDTVRVVDLYNYNLQQLADILKELEASEIVISSENTLELLSRYNQIQNNIFFTLFQIEDSVKALKLKTNIAVPESLELQQFNIF